MKIRKKNNVDSYILYVMSFSFLFGLSLLHMRNLFFINIYIFFNLLHRFQVYYKSIL